MYSYTQHWMQWGNNSKVGEGHHKQYIYST